MDDREKLVEILLEVSKNIMSFPSEGFNEHLADYLIAHGVTVREKQKPLTVEETLKKRVVYLEFKHLLLQEPVVMFRAWNEWEDAEIIHYDRFGCQYSNIDCPESDYGKTWRCWAEKPSEEERAAAEWIK